MSKDKISAIFNESSTWENEPINEILGVDNSAQSTALAKRIIMFGATQVGKTTLIHSLLGIKPECQGLLENQLRGDDIYGHSSTSTFVIYSRSKNDQFGIAICGINDSVSQSDIVYYSPDDFKKRISKIKKDNRNSSGFKNDVKITYIYIPSFYYAENAVSNLQIVDTRGFGERGTNSTSSNGSYASAEDINYVIDQMMPFASGVIAVERSDKIQALSSEYSQYLNKKSENQVLVVVSYAISNSDEIKKSLVNEIKNNTFDVSSCDEKIREYYNKTIIETEGYLSKKFDGRIFPIETKSYISKEQKISKAGCIVDLEIQHIIDEVDKMKCKTSINICKENIDTEISKMFELIDDNNSKINKINETIKKQKDLASVCGKELENFDRQDAAAKRKTKIELDRVTEQFELAKKYKKIDEYDADYYFDVDDFSSVSNEKSAESKTIKEVTASIKNYYGTPDFDKKYQMKIQEIIDEECSSCYYGKKLFKKWRKVTYENALYCFHNAFEAVRDYMFETLKNEKSKLTRQLNASNKDKKYISIKTEYDNHQKQIAKSENQILDLKQNNEKNEDRISKLKARKDNVEGIFAQAFYKKQNELVNRINEENNPEVKMALLTTLATIEFSMKDILIAQQQKGEIK